MFRRFLDDRRGAYAIAVVVAMVPLMGGLALAVDFAEMNRQRQATMNALDAAGVATAREAVTGATDDELKAYAKDFFEANLGPVDPAHTELGVVLPSNEGGGGTLKLTAILDYQPYFLPSFRKLLLGVAADGTGPISFSASTEVRLKNTLEVALVLDNSGSMAYTGDGSGEKRLDLLKAAAKELVSTLSKQAQQIQKVDKPVQFALVPFAGSVNVGPLNAGEAWMDTKGISPIHHENFDWSSLDDPDKGATNVGGIWYKQGVGWGTEAGEILSRFSLYKDMKKVDSREWIVTGTEWVCTSYRSNGTCRNGYYRETGYYENVIGVYATWQGCVEARPSPYNINGAIPYGDEFGNGDPASLYVPMFAPDEPGDRWATEDDEYPDNFSAANNWWNDGTESSSGLTRQRNMKKYFDVRPLGASSAKGSGPNYSCTSKPISRLTDVSTEEGLAAVNAAIEAMEASGATNVPEGLNWGWNALSSQAPFPDGRSEAERGNDKVVILLTDGENTYYTPGSLGYSDPAGNKSIYSAHGYLQPGYGLGDIGRLLLGTTSSVGKYNYSNGNYTAAINEHLDTLCANAKANGIILMTVALDLDASDSGQSAAIDALRRCASDSRFRMDPSDSSKADKLFWNATGGTLKQDFKEIADELSNLRIVS